ncbi:MAG: hypothetical protein C0P62_006005 [Bacillota bacterium]|nr:hypothetical protein [Bacillota bacterium]
MEQAWRQLRWDEAVRARALAIACRVDRQLEETAAIAKKPESRLAARLREELQRAAREGGSVEVLFRTAAAVHQQLAWLPKPKLPIGIRVFLRELFGGEWNEDLVVAALADPAWPLTVRVEGREPRVELSGSLGRGLAGRAAGGSPGGSAGDESDSAGGLSGALPVAVIPQAEMRDPMMWPLVALQGAVIAGFGDAVQWVRARVGPGLWFALSEAAAATGGPRPELEALWRRGLDELAAETALLDSVAELVEALADGILISAKRVGLRAKQRADGGGQKTEGLPARGEAGDRRDIYEELEAVRDVPAEASEILTAGWIHWYGQAAPALLATDEWERRRAIVDEIDDILCRSLDVAAIHRFYATEGASL